MFIRVHVRWSSTKDLSKISTRNHDWGLVIDSNFNISEEQVHNLDGVPVLSIEITAFISLETACYVPSNQRGAVMEEMIWLRRLLKAV